MFDKLRSVSNYIRKGWESTRPDSYSQYRRGRERNRKQAERERQDTDRSAGLEHEEAQRKREYEERYAAERAAKESQAEAPPDEPRTPQ